jgi:E3 ubiquitin-protein ligase TRIP12
MSNKSKKSRRKDLLDPEIGDSNADMMDLDEDQNDRPIDDEDSAQGATMDEEFGGDPENNAAARRAGISENIMRNLSSMRGLHGMMSNVHGTLKTILPNLRNNQDPTMQHIALQELAELLAISTEETLAGYLAPEPYVVELIKILKGGEQNSPFGDNPDVMLLASRCLANLMEALPQSTGTVVYSGAVPVLCSKLLEIQYIDLAEQALSVLSFLAC